MQHPGRFCRCIKMQNCRVGQTHARTDARSELIYKICVVYGLAIVHYRTKLAKFGYRSERKIKKVKNPAIAYRLNIANFQKKSHKFMMWPLWAIFFPKKVFVSFALASLFWCPQDAKNRQKQKRLMPYTCHATNTLLMITH